MSQPLGHRNRVVVSSRRTRPVYDRWRDEQGTHIGDRCRVEQIEVEKQHGALRSRLRKQGVVVGRAGGTNGNRVYVLFDGENEQVSIRPYLVRVLPADTGTPPLTAEHIIEQLDGLLPPATTAGDGGHPMSIKWGLSPLDWRSHAVDEHQENPTGGLKAECGHLLMMDASLHEEPCGTQCETCAAKQLAALDGLRPSPARPATTPDPTTTPT